MEIFKCKYLNHKNEEIIGFCLNQNCQNATQYCYECLNTTHSEHFKDCIRFIKMIQFIEELIHNYNKSRNQFKEISKQLQNYFEQIQKKMDQDIIVLENMNKQLLNKDYLNFKSQINIIKRFYKKENDNYICIIVLEIIIEQQILKCNNILETIKKMVQDQIQVDEQINQVIYVQSKQNNQEVLRIVQQGIALNNLQKYQEAIECYDKAISINPKYEQAWNNKGFALRNLQKYQEAIECYDKAISINPKFEYAWINKGITLIFLENLIQIKQSKEVNRILVKFISQKRNQKVCIILIFSLDDKNSKILFLNINIRIIYQVTNYNLFNHYSSNRMIFKNRLMGFMKTLQCILTNFQN